MSDLLPKAIVEASCTIIFAPVRMIILSPAIATNDAALAANAVTSIVM